MARKNKRTKQIPVLKLMIQMHGLSMKDVGNKLDVSQITLRSMLSDPQHRMNGVRRAALADILGLPVTTIDAACRGELCVMIQEKSPPIA